MFMIPSVLFDGERLFVVRSTLSLPLIPSMLKRLNLRNRADSFPIHAQHPDFVNVSRPRQLSDAPCTPNRNSRRATPDPRFETIRLRSAQTSSLGPIPLDLALTPLARVALGSHSCQARDGHRMASQRFPPVLDLEKPARSIGEAKDFKGYS